MIKIDFKSILSACYTAHTIRVFPSFNLFGDFETRFIFPDPNGLHLTHNKTLDIIPTALFNIGTH